MQLDVMTVEQLSVYLQIAQSTLLELAQVGKVPGLKMGKDCQNKRVVIDRWIEDQPGARLDELPF